METLDLLQGSDKWLEVRRNYLVASEAPVIMGASKHTRRDELLFLKKTGEEKSINDWVEKFVFKPGHDAEEKARPIAEKILGQDLYPVTGIADIDGLQLLASYDGITMLEDIHWEHKQFNSELFLLVSNNEPLWTEHYWQLEHQMLVAGTESCIFAVSDGTEENYVECIYQSDKDRREQLIEGWKLFLSDLESYEPNIKPAEIVGKVPMELPALRIEISGGVTSSNLATFKEVAIARFKEINTELNTDEDFADAEQTVKWCDSVEKKLDAAKQHALSQTASIDELFRTIDDVREEARKVRLNLSKKVVDRKKERKLEIAKKAKSEFDKHIELANKALGGDYMPIIATDFNAAMKGKRTIATLESAAQDELARARIEANRVCSRIDENLVVMNDLAKSHEYLFPDKKRLVADYEKTALEAIVKQRIAEEMELKEKQVAKVDSSKETVVQQIDRTINHHGQNNIGNLVSTEKQKRPSDSEIIETLALHYKVHESVVLGWLMEINLKHESSKLMNHL